MERPHKALPLPTLVPQLSPGKAPVQLFESQTELVVVFTWNVKWLTTVVILFGCLADIFSKVNKVSLSFRGKQPTVFVVHDKIWDFNQKNENFGTLVLTTTSFTTSQYLKVYSDESGNY